MFFLLIFVVLIVFNVPISQYSSLDEDRECTPAEKDDGQFQQVPLTFEVSPSLLPHQLPLESVGGVIHVYQH